VRAVASTSPVSMATDMCFLDDNALVAAVAAANEEGEEGGDGEEDAVHDPEGEGSFEEGADFVGFDVESSNIHPHIPEINPICRTTAHVRAIRMRDKSELVDTSDESTDETEIDEGDE